MRRCTSCFRFQAGHPTFCSYCGRSFDVRICSRGHHNPRGVQYCADCGSADLSTPSAPASLSFRLSSLILYTFAGLIMGLFLTTAVLSLLHRVDWQAMSGPFVMLMLMLGVLYWTMTLLPGPVKKLGKAAGRMAMKPTRTGKHK